MHSSKRRFYYWNCKGSLFEVVLWSQSCRVLEQLWIYKKIIEPFDDFVWRMSL